jgi:hypothetical protein
VARGPRAIVGHTMGAYRCASPQRSSHTAPPPPPVAGRRNRPTPPLLCSVS